VGEHLVRNPLHPNNRLSRDSRIGIPLLLVYRLVLDRRMGGIVGCMFLRMDISGGDRKMLIWMIL
jgi:hypothetical protein